MSKRKIFVAKSGAVYVKSKDVAYWLTIGFKFTGVIVPEFKTVEMLDTI